MKKILAVIRDVFGSSVTQSTGSTNYSSYSDEHWNNTINKINDEYYSVFGERPFSMNMATADYNLLMCNLQLHYIVKSRESLVK